MEYEIMIELGFSPAEAAIYCYGEEIGDIDLDDLYERVLEVS